MRVYAQVFETPEHDGPPLANCTLDFHGGGMPIEPQSAWASDPFEAGDDAPLEFLRQDSVPPDLKISLVCELREACRVEGTPFSQLEQQPLVEVEGLPLGLFQRTSTAALAISIDPYQRESYFYEVTIDGAPRMLRPPVPDLVVTAAAAYPEPAHLILAGKRFDVPEIYDYAQHATPFAALPMRFVGAPRGVAISGKDRSLFVTAEDGMLWHFESGGWTQTSSLALEHGERARVAWLRDDIVYHSSPLAFEIYRYDPFTGSERDMSTMLNFEHGADDITMFVHVPPLGIVVGTRNGFIAYGERDAWHRIGDPPPGREYVHAIETYGPGFLIGGRHGHIDHYDDELELCEDGRVALGLDILVGSILQLDGGIVVSAQLFDNMAGYIAVLR